MGPELSSRFRFPIPSPQTEPKAGPSPTPSVPSQAADRPQLTPEGPGLWFQILRTDTKAILSPPHRHPSSKEGEVPEAVERCHPAVRPCHTLSNLSATSWLPDISGPRSPQQHLGVDCDPDAPSPAASGPARAVRYLLYIVQPAFPPRSRPPPSRVPGSLAGSSAALAAVPSSAPASSPQPHQRPPRRPGSAQSRTLTPRPPSGSRGRHAVRPQPGLCAGTWAAPFLPRASRPDQGGS